MESPVVARKAKSKTKNLQSKLSSDSEPSVDRSRYPSTYSHLGYEKFQYFCAELLGKEHDVSTSNVYGNPGQRQHGIDIKAARTNGKDLEVGQCKAYQKITAAEIKEASDEFLNHWETKWKNEGIKRFILFAGCSLQDTKLSDQIDQERKRFSGIGVIYEAWSNMDITTRLRPFRSIAQTFLDDPWPDRICGKPTASSRVEDLSSETRNQIRESALINQIETLVVEKYEGELAKWKDSFKRGKGDVVLSELRTFKSDATKWLQIPSATKAKIIRFECRLLLSKPKPSHQEIQRLFEEAKGLAPNDPDVCLEALILGQDSPSKAVDVLQKSLTAESLNLKAAFLIEAGRYPEAKATLELVPEEPINCEKLRLSAYLAMMERDFENGLSHIEKALKSKPDLPSLKVVKGKLLFYQTYSPGVLGSVPVSYPLPLHSSMIRLTEATAPLLKSATEIFRDLHIHYPGELRDEYSLWYFASLCIDPEKKDQAIQLAQELSERFFKNSVFISWLLASDIEFPRIEYGKKISDYLSENRADVSAITSQLLILAQNAQYEEARIFLGKYQRAFKEARMVDKYQHWRMELALKSIKSAREIKRYKTKTLTPHLKALLAERWLRLQPNDPHVLEYCKRAIEFEFDLPFTLFVAEIAQRFGDWQFIIEKAELLLLEFPSQSTLELISIACNNAGRFDLADKYISQHKLLLTSKTRQLLARAKEKMGNLPEAIAQAEQSLREAKSEDAFLFLCNLLIAKYDFPSIKSHFEFFKSQIALKPKSKVFLAYWLSVDFPDTAKGIVQELLNQKISDDLIPPIISISYDLGMDNETGPLIREMQRIAMDKSNSIVQAMSMREVKRVVVRRRDSYINLYKEFQQGNLPIHFFAARFGFTLANYFLSNLKANEEENNFPRKAAIYSVYAARPLHVSQISIKGKRVCLDLTSFLFFHFYGLLDILENSVEAIVLPHDTLLLFAHMRRQLSQGQKSRVRACDEVLGFCDSGKIKKFSPNTFMRVSKKALNELGTDTIACVVQAKSTNAFVLDFSPAEKRPLVERIKTLKSLSTHIIGCGDLAESTFEFSPTAEHEKSQIQSKLGVHAADLTGSSLQRGASIVLTSGLATLLQSAGLLRKAHGHFEFWIADQEYNILRNESRAHRQSDELSLSLKKLADKISSGVESGKYELLPYKPIPNQDAVTDLESSFLYSFLSISKDSASLAVSDDRFINSHLTVGNVPVLSFIEVLNLLKNSGSILEQQYFDILLRLRNSNIRFIKLEKDEIAKALPQILPGGSVKETANLGLLRRYLASSLLDSESLQTPPFAKMPAFQNGEMSYYLDSVKPLISVIANIWASDAEKRNKVIKSEMLLDSLFLDHISLAALMHRLEPVRNCTELYSNTVLLFFLEGLAANRMSNRSDFLQWLEDRLVVPILDSNPEILPAIGEKLIGLIESTLRSAPKKNVEGSSCSLQHVLFRFAAYSQRIHQ